jgi:uncharacterized protein YeaO (DUF488 family)
VRRPPRGVPAAEYSRRDFYDVWLPVLSPSAPLIAQVRTTRDAVPWRRFMRRFSGEMRQPEAARALDLLAALSHQTNLSIGCYCLDESRCHRGVLRALLAERRAKLV